MAVSFQLPPWRKAFNAEKFKRQESVIVRYEQLMGEILKEAAQEMIDAAIGGRPFHEPHALASMQPTMEKFYHDVIGTAWNTARLEKHLQIGKKRLASMPKGKIPPLKDLVALFGDRRAWPLIMKRSKVLAERLRKAYLRKLRTRFTKVVPALLSGSMAPREAHAKLMQAWDASKSRVNTIFRTETTKYFTETQVAYFGNDPDIIGFLFDSVRDTARTGICKSRHGLVYLPGSKKLKENFPPCFTGSTPVLTLTGWQRIDTLIVGQYVWTHANRWRKITKVHSTPAQLQWIFQIGYGMATANHPYRTRGGRYISAQHFRPKAGVWAIPSYLRLLWATCVETVLQKECKILCSFLSLGGVKQYTERCLSSIFFGGALHGKGGVHCNLLPKPPTRIKQGASIGAPSSYGKYLGEIFKKIRNCAPHQWCAHRQPPGKFAGNDKFRASAFAPYREKKTNLGQAQVEVFNLDVEDDHTYVAGGFVVHNCHWNCRSHLIALTDIEYNRNLIKDQSRNPEKVSVAPLPPGWQGGK